MKSIKDTLATKTLPNPVKTGDDSEMVTSSSITNSAANYDQQAQLKAILEALPPRYKDIKPDHALYDQLKRRSLLLTGAVGSGKTRKLLEVMVAHLLETYGKRFYLFDNGYIPVTQKQIQTLFLSVPMVLFSLKDEFDHKPQGDSLLEKMIKAPVLFLDDLGAEKASDWVKEQLYIVINERYNWMRPVLLTTNLTVKEIADNYGDRFASRIVEMCETINYGGADKRLDRRTKTN